MPSDPVQSYAWRPAPLARPVEVTISPGGISLSAGWSLCWDEVTGLRFHTGSWGDSTMVRLDLLSARGTRRLSCNGAEPPGTGGRKAHLDAMRATLRTLLPLCPDLRVALYPGGRVLRAIGAISLVGGMALMGAAALSGALVAGALPFGLMMALGAALVWDTRPGRASADLSLPDFLACLDSLE